MQQNYYYTTTTPQPTSSSYNPYQQYPTQGGNQRATNTYSAVSSQATTPSTPYSTNAFYTQQQPTQQRQAYPQQQQQFSQQQYFIDPNLINFYHASQQFQPSNTYYYPNNSQFGNVTVTSQKQHQVAAISPSAPPLSSTPTSSSTATTPTSTVPLQGEDLSKKLELEQPDRKTAFEAIKEYLYLDDRGKYVNLFWGHDTLVKYGRKPVLYLNYVIAVTILFFFLILLHLPHLVFFAWYPQPETESLLFRLSSANWDRTDFLANLILSIFEAILCVFFIIFFRLLLFHNSRLNKVTEKVVAVNTFAVHVRNVPFEEVNYGTKRLTTFFSAFGNVDSVVLFLNCGPIKKLKENMEKYESLIRSMKLRIDLGWRFQKVYKLLLRIFIWLYERDRKKFVRRVEKKEYRCTGDALVVFKTERDKYKALHAFNKPLLSSCCGLTIPRYVQGRKLRVEKAPAAKDIEWQNFEYSIVSKFFRRMIAFLITLISVLLQVSAGYVIEYIRFFVIPSIRYSETQVAQDVVSTVLSGVLAAVEYVNSSVVVFIIFYLVSFEKHRLVSHYHKSLVYKLTLASILDAVSVIVVYFTAVSPAQVTSGRLPEDFADWFKVNSLFFLTVIGMIVFAALTTVVKDIFMAPFYFIKKKILERLVVSQQELIDVYTPPTYSVEYRYAFQLKLILLGLLFCGLWPLVLPLCFVPLALSYAIDKYNLFRVYRKFPMSKDYISKAAIKCTVIGAFGRYVFLCFLELPAAFSSSVIPIHTNFYAMTLIVVTLVMFLFVLVQIVIPSISIGTLCCFSVYRFPKYVTGKAGKTSIDEYEKVKRYKPPVTPSEVKNRYNKERRKTIEMRSIPESTSGML